MVTFYTFLTSLFWVQSTKWIPTDDNVKINWYSFVPNFRWKVLTRPARAGLELTTSRLLSKSTTTRLRQPVRHVRSIFSQNSSVFVCLFICFESHEQFFSYLATVTIAVHRAANLDPRLAPTASSSEGSLTCHTHCDTEPPSLRSYPKDSWFYLLNAVLLAKKQSLPILNVLGLTRPTRAGLELTTYRLPSESTTTRLRQPIKTRLFTTTCESESREIPNFEIAQEYAILCYKFPI
jgi:hypothetical protein